jgi:predicted HAD superfamily phosphohydrolase YqeG
VDWIFLAMAKARLAQSGVKTAATDLDSRRKQEAYDTEARNWLAQAREKIEGTEIVSGKSREIWDRLEMELFLAEA